MLTLEVVDLNNTPLPDPKVSIAPSTNSTIINVMGNIVTIKNPPNYGEVKLEWASATYGTMCAKTKVFQLERLQNKIEKVEMPVGDVEIQVVDSKINPLPNVTVEFGGRRKITDSMGRVIFERVPLEYDWTSIKYDIRIYHKGLLIYSTSMDVAVSEKLRIKRILVPLTELIIYVTDLKKQPLPSVHVRVQLSKNNQELFTTTSLDGCVKISKILIGKEYSINAEYKGFKECIKVTVLDAQSIVIRLPIYKEYFGLPVGSFLGFLIETLKIIGPSIIAFIIGYLLK